jgi:hypothetical protein
LRRDASLLISEGFANANKIALATLWTEADIARQRIADRIASEATILQTAMASIVSKKGGSAFEKALKVLRGSR